MALAQVGRCLVLAHRVLLYKIFRIRQKLDVNRLWKADSVSYADFFEIELIVQHAQPSYQADAQKIKAKEATWKSKFGTVVFKKSRGNKKIGAESSDPNLIPLLK